MRDLGPAEEIVAAAVGEPGQRHFYLQITAAGETVWLPAEKQQVASLASQSLTLLNAADLSPDHEAVALIKGQLTLRPPETEGFRVGGIQIAVLESQLITLVVTSPEEHDSLRFLITPEQLAAMAELALEVVAAGRPICPRCQLPEDPAGHRCPAVNGHHPS